MQALLSTILALLSGLLGAIIGGIIAGKYSRDGSIQGARIATQHAESLFDKERELRAADRKSEIRGHLLAELKLGAQIVGTMLGSSYTTLLTDAWSRARGDITLLGKTTDEKITELYARIHRYNDGAGGYKPQAGDSRDPIDRQARELRPMIVECIEFLQKQVAEEK